MEKKVTDLSVEVAKEKKLNVDQATELTLLREELVMTVVGLREELVDDANRYIWQTKARLMKQYMEGLTSSWTPEADVRQFLEVFGTFEDLHPDDVGASDTMATVDSGVNDNTTDTA